MTEGRLPLIELLQKAGEGDFLRAVAEAVLQLLMEADVECLIGAGRHEVSVALSGNATICSSYISNLDYTCCGSNRLMQQIPSTSAVV